MRPESEARQDTGQEWWAWDRSHSTLGMVVRGGYTFLRRQVRWSGIPIALRIFHSLL